MSVHASTNLSLGRCRSFCKCDDARYVIFNLMRLGNTDNLGIDRYDNDMITFAHFHVVLNLRYQAFKN